MLPIFPIGSQPTGKPRHQHRFLVAILSIIILFRYASASEVWGWGFPRVVPRPIKALGGGTNKTIAVLEDGRVISWGVGIYARHRAPQDLGPVRKAVGNDRSIIALLEDGSVRVWGDTSKIFQPPAGLDQVIDIAAAGDRFMALRADGSAIGWGDNRYGQSDVPAIARNLSAIAVADNHSLALTNDGIVLGWGDTTSGKSNVPPLGQKAVSIAASNYNSFAVLEDGKVVGWGDTTFPSFNFRLLPIPDSAMDAISVHAYEGHAVVRKRNGRVFAWGSNSFNESNYPESEKGLHGLALGGEHVIGFRPDGSVVGWGSRYSGLASPVYWFEKPLGEITTIATGGGALFALDVRGKIHVAGSFIGPVYDIPGDLGFVTSIAAGDRHVLALISDGTVRAWGDTLFGNTNVPSGLRDVASVHASADQSAAVLSSGRIVRWGNTIANLDSLTQSLGQPVKFSLGDWHVLMIDSAGRVGVAGKNRFGEAKVSHSSSPVLDVAAGIQISALLNSMDTVSVFGRLGSFSVHVPRAKKLTAGNIHVAVLSSDGKVTGIGKDNYGECFTPIDVEFADQISASGSMTAALVGSSPPVSTDSSRHRFGSRLPAGEYQISLVNLAGRRMWTGRSRWTGSRWDLPREFKGLFYVQTVGSRTLPIQPLIVGLDR